MAKIDNVKKDAKAIAKDWKDNPRWKDVKRDYTAEEVAKLRPSVMVEQTIAHRGAERLWDMLNSMDYVHTFGAITGNQATQMIRAGLQSIYLSGWQVAADGNRANQTYPDMSLYPCNSVPDMVKRINNALIRADQIDRMNGGSDTDWYAPIVADAEAGFGGALHCFELMKAMIEAGVSGVHYEDQLAAAKKCGHMGGKVLVPTSQFIQSLNAARLAADVLDVPTLLVARTDSLAATLLTTDVDERDKPFLAEGRTAEGFYNYKNGMESAIARGLAYAPYADLLWMETSKPTLEEAKVFAEAIKKEHPDQMMAYNCSPSFNWKAHLEFRGPTATGKRAYSRVRVASNVPTPPEPDIPSGP